MSKPAYFFVNAFIIFTNFQHFWMMNSSMLHEMRFCIKCLFTNITLKTFIVSYVEKPALLVFKWTTTSNIVLAKIYFLSKLYLFMHRHIWYVCKFFITKLAEYMTILIFFMSIPKVSIQFISIFWFIVTSIANLKSLTIFMWNYVYILHVQT